MLVPRRLVILALAATVIGWTCPSYSQSVDTSAQDSVVIQDSVISSTVQPPPNPGSAFRRSLVFPGLGQWYIGEHYEAFAWGGVFWTSIGFATAHWDKAVGYDGPGSIFWSREGWTRGRNNWLILAGFTYLLCSVDAYVDAHMMTFDVEPLTSGAGSDGWKLGIRIALHRP